MSRILPLFLLMLWTASTALASDEDCAGEPKRLTTAAGVEFVRTPDACFEGLPDWPYEPRYVEIDGLRQGYAEAGPADGPTVLLLHGQPTWSYLYRKMIPVLADAGFRVIAMDHLGMGRSDKPTAVSSYSYLGHNERLWSFIEKLDLRDIHLFVQDWGSLIGLRIAGLHPERFAKIAVGDGMLPVIPASMQPFPAVEKPDEVVDLPSPFASLPAQQVPFYDGCELLVEETIDFGDWIRFSMTARSFQPSQVIEALTWFDLPSAEEAAYDAPFPHRAYLTGARVFPSLVNQVPGTTLEAWQGLGRFERPFLALWAANDPGNLGSCQAQQRLITHVPGAKGQPHDRLPEASHFLQDDQGAEIARRLVSFYRGSNAEKARGASRLLDRYCELLLVKPTPRGLEAEVWGTPGLNDCPQDAWDSIDIEAVKAETGAVHVVRNGPRHWLSDGVAARPTARPARRSFGALDMHRLAVVEIGDKIRGGIRSEGGGTPGNQPYSETLVRRTTTFTFRAGSDVFELTSPEGNVYTMQSFALIVDPTLTRADLPRLDRRLDLPDGWSFAARTLESDLVLEASGKAVVLVDDLGNAYQGR